MASCTADWQLEQQYRAKLCIIKVVWWSCAVCDLVLAPWWLSWPPHIHWASAMGGDVLITEPSLTLPLHLSLLASFSMESAPSSYSLMRNNNPSSSQHYIVWEGAAYHCGQWWRVVEVQVVKCSHQSVLSNNSLGIQHKTFECVITQKPFKYYCIWILFLSKWMAGQNLTLIKDYNTLVVYIKSNETHNTKYDAIQCYY